MKRNQIYHEVYEVLWAFFDPKDPANPGDRALWQANPIQATQEVIAFKNFDWNENRVRAFASNLVHESTVSTVELMENILGAEEMIWDTIHSIKPAYWSTLVINSITFLVGVALILTSVIASLGGQDLIGIIFGGTGLATIIFVFFRQPFTGIERSISNQIQLEIIYNSYVKQLGYWKAYSKIDDVENDVKNKPKIVKEIRLCTQRTLELIETYSKHAASSSAGGVEAILAKFERWFHRL